MGDTRLVRYHVATSFIKLRKSRKRRSSCGGHFSGSTVGNANIGGNPAGDAVYTFIAQSRRMVVNACSSDYDTVIRVFHKYTTLRRYGRRYVPYNQYHQIAYNDDHWTCRQEGNPYGSKIHLNYLTVGREYTLQIEGYRYRAGNYRVNLTCVSPFAHLFGG